MRQRKHAKPGKKSTHRSTRRMVSKYHPSRRRKRFMNAALIVAGMMALSLAFSGYSFRAGAPLPQAPETSTAQTTDSPAEDEPREASKDVLN